ncbi:MAG TPA: hypothetical protein VGD41_17880 [Pyrinomonadaceae bacterium]
MKSLRIEISVLAIVALVGISGALALSLRPGPLQFQQEWVRALLQMGLIAVFGIVTSAVLESFKDALQFRRDRGKLKLDTFNEINRAYLDVKLVRRRLQASGSLSTDDVTHLNERQLLLEQHKNNSCVLFSKPDEVQQHLRAMERYLNRAANKPQSPERANFASRGFDEFSDHYHALADLLRVDVTANRRAKQKADKESVLGDDGS